MITLQKKFYTFIYKTYQIDCIQLVFHFPV